jgi:insertion element IS1 protein InsB
VKSNKFLTTISFTSRPGHSWERGKPESRRVQDPQTRPSSVGARGQKLLSYKYFHGPLTWRPHESWLLSRSGKVSTVLRELKKKEAVLESVNTSLLHTLDPTEVAWSLERAGEAEAEMDEMWSFVGHKGNPRWLWHAIDHHTGKVLAYVFGRRKDEVFLRLKALLEPFGLTRYYTDYWGTYTRHLDPAEHCPGKRNTQKIERKHLTLRTHIKRLVRKTICFSKTTQMHDIVIGLFVNRYAFGRAV